MAPGKYRCSVGDDIGTGIFDGTRSAVIRIYAHPSTAQNQIGALFDKMQDIGCDRLTVITRQCLPDHLNVVFEKFFFQYRSKSVFDQPFLYFASGCNDSGLFYMERKQRKKQASLPAASTATVHFFLFSDDKGNDFFVPAILSPFFTGKFYHVLRQFIISPRLVDCYKCIPADFEKSVTVCNQFDLALFDITSMHMGIGTDAIQISAASFS